MNASACADRRSRARCSVSLKIRPPYSRSPSHTASPPCTTESNGLIPAWSRWTSVSSIPTTRSRLRSSYCCCIRSPAGSEAVRRERVVVGPAPLQQRRQPVGQRVARAGGVRREAGRGLDAGVPVRRPDAVGVARPGGPRQHRLVEADAERGAEQPERRPRVAQHVGGVDHRAAVRLEELQPAAAARGPPGSAPRGPSRTTSAPVPGRGPGTRGSSGASARALDRPAAGGGSCASGTARASPAARRSSSRDDLGRVGRLRRDHLVPAGVVEPGGREVGGVQRLVDHRAVRAVLEAAHQRGRELRGPDHIAIRTVIAATPGRTARTRPRRPRSRAPRAPRTTTAVVAMHLEPVPQRTVALTLIPGELLVRAGQRSDPDVGRAEHAGRLAVADHEHVVVVHLWQRGAVGLEVGHQARYGPLGYVEREAPRSSACPAVRPNANTSTGAPIAPVAAQNSVHIGRRLVGREGPTAAATGSHRRLCHSVAEGGAAQWGHEQQGGKGPRDQRHHPLHDVVGVPAGRRPGPVDAGPTARPREPRSRSCSRSWPRPTSWSAASTTSPGCAPTPT